MQPMILQSTIYLLVWGATHVLASRNGPSTRIAPAITRINSRVYSILSFLLFLLIISPVQAHNDLGRHLFHLSKFWEYIDIIGVCAAGGTIDAHFGFHHLTTPWLSHVRFLPGCEGWRWFAAANTAHHALMYAHFGGWWRGTEVLLWTGKMQLWVGIVVDAVMMLRGGGDEVWRFGVSAGILGTYLVLSAREERKRSE